MTLFAGKEKAKRKFRYLPIVLIIMILYLLVVLLSYRRQPEVSAAYKEMFRAEDYRSDKPSTERACIIEDNSDALVHRLRMIREAKDRIILSTFDFRPDESGKDVMAALLEAAGRGVDIKVLVDGFSALNSMSGDPCFYAVSSADNIEFRIYNPINLLAPWKFMGRLHDKYLIVDDGLYLLGGRNTYDYFLGENGYKNYDRDVLVWETKPEAGGHSLDQLLTYFQSVWDYKECKVFHETVPFYKKKKTLEARQELTDRYSDVCQRYPQILESCDYADITFAANQISLLANPIHVHPKEPTVFYALTKLMEEADDSVMIHTPYVICNQWMYDSLRELCSGTAHVSMMTNSVANNGNPFGSSDYKKNKEKLLDTGLDIREYEGGVSYHGKSIIIDDDMSAVGSFNIDMRSVYLDTELMLVIHSKEVTNQLKDYMESYEKSSVRALPGDGYEVPEGVTRQTLTGKRAFRIKVLSMFQWLRYLM